MIMQVRWVALVVLCCVRLTEAKSDIQDVGQINTQIVLGVSQDQGFGSAGQVGSLSRTMMSEAKPGIKGVGHMNTQLVLGVSQDYSFDSAGRVGSLSRTLLGTAV